MCEAPLPGDSVALFGGVLHLIGFFLAGTGFLWTWQYAKRKGKKVAHIDRFFVTIFFACVWTEMGILGGVFGGFTGSMWRAAIGVCVWGRAWRDDRRGAQGAS